MQGCTDGNLPATLSQALDNQPADRVAFTDAATGRTLSFGEARRSAIAYIGALQSLALRADDTVIYLLEDSLQLVPILVASCDLGLHLVIRCASSRHAHDPAGPRRHPAKLVIGSARLRRFWHIPDSPRQYFTPQELRRAGESSILEWRAANWAGRDSAQLGFCLHGSAEPTWIAHSLLLQSAANLLAAYPISAADTLLSTSSALTLEGLCTAVVAPMLLGMQAILAESSLLHDPDAYWQTAERTGATVCENPAEGFHVLAEADAAQSRHLPDAVRLLLAGSGIVSPPTALHAEGAWQRRIQQGWGTAEHGLWLAHSRLSGPPDALQLRTASVPGSELAIRRLRMPLTLLAPEEPGAELGEILLRPDSAAAPAKPRSHAEFRTGDLGRLTNAGDLVVRHRLADVAIRDACTVLLTEVDAQLCQHPQVSDCKTFREQSNSPFSRIIAACVTDLAGSELREWLAARLHPRWLPDEIVPVQALPRGPALDVEVDALRAIVSGAACNDLVAALTARKFRRSPCYKEPELRQRIQSALLSLRPLDFFMFWGCGPRREAAAPDRAALAALEDLLDTVSRVSPIQARATIVLTDIHARNNGYPQDHYEAYSGDIQREAAGLNVSFQRESDIWARAGLSMERVIRFAASPEFEAKWQVFPLQDRFVSQASRHSKMADRTEAARRYYAICLLEREVLKTAFAGSVFLTYNGPEFNACFPDLPTLYVYPGLRGRTDKPWFVQAAPEPSDPAAAPQPAPVLMAS